MLKIATSFDPSGPVTLTLAGSAEETSLVELEQAIEIARRTDKPVFLDLSEITLLDRKSLQFLISQMRRNVQLLNCPQYIERWLCREEQEQ